MPEYSTRAQLPRKSHYIPHALRRKIYAETKGRCYYCGWIAECLDHIIPYSYGGTDDGYNLVAACQQCNNVLSDLLFDDVDAKRTYIRDNWLHTPRYRFRELFSRCVRCKKVFRQRWEGSTLFYCLECMKRL